MSTLFDFDGNVPSLMVCSFRSILFSMCSDLILFIYLLQNYKCKDITLTTGAYLPVPKFYKTLNSWCKKATAQNKKGENVRFGPLNQPEFK